MKNYSDGALKLQVESDESTVNIKWLGKSKERNPSETLLPYFNELIAELKDSKVIVDFTHLEFMNSSTVTSIVQFIKDLDKKAIDVHILYNKSSEWQNASFKALEIVVSTMKKVSIEGI